MLNNCCLNGKECRPKAVRSGSTMHDRELLSQYLVIAFVVYCQGNWFFLDSFYSHVANVVLLWKNEKSFSIIITRCSPNLELQIKVNAYLFRGGQSMIFFFNSLHKPKSTLKRKYLLLWKQILSFNPFALRKLHTVLAF